MTRRSRLAARPRLERLDSRRLPAALTPLQVAGAYGLNAITLKTSNGATVEGDGSGQTIAIIAAYHNPYLANELAAFNATYGLPSATLAVTNQAGTRVDAGWAEEEALDVEWAHAAAPGAKILVVEARSSSTSDILAAINAARNTAGVSVVSMSFGISDFAAEVSYDAYFKTPAGHTGITFVAASGDEGAGAEWPASSPYVVAVGGTTLNLSSSGSVIAETAWSGSGGGTSRYEAEPSYQRGVQSTGHRQTPDVAMVANPSTGVSVYYVSPTTGRGTWAQVGGTSLSAPLFAGLIAIADQGRALKGLGTLDGATQTLPALYASAGTVAYDDVTAGWRATAGYDTVTGLGSPNAAALVANLVSTTRTTPLTTSTSTATSSVSPATATTTGTGSTGNKKTTPGRNAGRARWGYASELALPSISQNVWSMPLVLANAGQLTAAKAPMTITFASRRLRPSFAVPVAIPKAAEQATDEALETWVEEPQA